MILKLIQLYYTFSEQNQHSRYPYIDNRQGKFTGRQYFNARDILTGNEPDEKQFVFIEYLRMINKIKNIVKKQKHNLRELRDIYQALDEVMVLT